MIYISAILDTVVVVVGDAFEPSASESGDSFATTPFTPNVCLDDSIARIITRAAAQSHNPSLSPSLPSGETRDI